MAIQNPTITYRTCTKVIANGSYKTKEDMMLKLDVFLLGNRISLEEYNELVAQLEAKEAERIA